jgi:hypothetical protein
MSNNSENTQQRADMPGEGLDWQSELDSAMSDIDSRLRHPRRRASDTGPQPQFPELGQVELTSELLDEIAWRVSQQMRRTQAAAAAADFALPAPPPAIEPAQATAAPSPARPTMPAGVSMVIRYRWPLFRLPFTSRRKRRRRDDSMLQLRDYRATS